MSGRAAVRGPAGAMAESDHYAGESPSADDVTEILAEVVKALDADGVPYLVMGGLVANAFARPRTTDDIDIFVMPEPMPTPGDPGPTPPTQPRPQARGLL